MALAAGIHRVGPHDGRIEVRTGREGVAARAGHDLVIEVARWEARVSVGEDGTVSAIELDADPSSLEIREGLHGVKPLNDRDRREIKGNIDEKVLGGRPVAFRSTAVRRSGGGDRLGVEGQLTLAGETRPLTVELDLHAGGSASGRVTVTQSRWGIKPYRGLMGALRVRDDVEVLLEGRLPAR